MHTQDIDRVCGSKSNYQYKPNTHCTNMKNQTTPH